MSGVHLSRRLNRLERAGDGSGRVVVMERRDDEPDEVAEARWHLEHRGEVIPPAALRVVLIKYSG